VWHSEREFVHYDMFLPVTFPAKKTKKTRVINNLFSVGYNFQMNKRGLLADYDLGN